MMPTVADNSYFISDFAEEWAREVEERASS
jgi:hypothetical protein